MGPEARTIELPNILAMGFIQPRAPNNSQATPVIIGAFWGDKMFQCPTKTKKRERGRVIASVHSQHWGSLYDDLPGLLVGWGGAYPLGPLPSTQTLPLPELTHNAVS